MKTQRFFWLRPIDRRSFFHSLIFSVAFLQVWWALWPPTRLFSHCPILKHPIPTPSPPHTCVKLVLFVLLAFFIFLFFSAFFGNWENFAWKRSASWSDSPNLGPQKDNSALGPKSPIFGGLSYGFEFFGHTHRWQGHFDETMTMKLGTNTPKGQILPCLWGHNRLPTRLHPHSPLALNRWNFEKSKTHTKKICLFWKSLCLFWSYQPARRQRNFQIFQHCIIMELPKKNGLFGQFLLFPPIPNATPLSKTLFKLSFLSLSLYLFFIYIYNIYIYIYMAKASFSAYVLIKNLLKTGEKMHFSTKKTRPILVFLFVSSLFPFLPQKWPK